MNLRFIVNALLNSEHFVHSALRQEYKANIIMYMSYYKVEIYDIRNKIWLDILHKQNINSPKNSSQIIKRRKLIHKLKKLPGNTRIALRKIDNDILLNRKLAANLIYRKLTPYLKLKEIFFEAMENLDQATYSCEKAIEVHESLDSIIDNHNY